jgi:outer membrane protein OmpA-like peptidoglycan-associated protein
MKNITLFDSIEKTVSKNRLAKEGETDSRVRTEVLDSNLRFENGNVYYNDNICGNYDEIGRKIFLDQQKCRNHKGLNPLTSHPSLPSNATIEVQNGKNKHILETDHLGRKTKLTNIFKEKIVDDFKGTRENDEQTKAKMFGDEDGFVDTHFKQKDQGGHGSSASGGSLKEMAYIFPQAHKVNNSKEWKEIEDAQRAELNREKVDFKTINKFEYEGNSRRPSFVKSEINGVENNSSAKFNNSNSDSVPVLAEKTIKQPKFQKAFVPPVQPNKPSGSSNSSNKWSNSKRSSSFNSNNSPKIPIKLILAILGIVILILLFLWFNDIFPFNSKSNQTYVVPKTEIITDESNSNEINPLNENSTKSKMSFAKPLDDLTKSIINISEFNSIVENENTIPVIGAMFEYNSTTISNNGKTILAGFANEFRKLEVPNKVLIEGFTCTIGSKEFNEKLSEKRANNLKAELIRLGIAENVIVIKPIGMQNFVSTDNGNNDLILNRRSNVTIMSAE